MDYAVPEGARIGHVHLKVSDLDKALSFYQGLLGFQIMQRYGTQAVFVSAGGYHHHIGLNTWYSKNAPPGQEFPVQYHSNGFYTFWEKEPPDGDQIPYCRFRRFTFVLPAVVGRYGKLCFQQRHDGTGSLCVFDLRGNGPVFYQEKTGNDMSSGCSGCGFHFIGTL